MRGLNYTVVSFIKVVKSACKSSQSARTASCSVFNSSRFNNWKDKGTQHFPGGIFTNLKSY